MADDLPYKAEYAKSGRASCKACKTPIIKDTLRLAVMVQSPRFDGKVPNWYHEMCFFGKQRPKSVGDISHFDSLRWEDQEKIRVKIDQGNAGDAAVQVEGGKKKGKKRVSETIGGLKDFSVEYAKSGRATCKGCDQKILKDEVRISKKDFESENAKMYGGQERWHHVECFEKLRNDLEFWESGADLPGFKCLSKEDQQMIKNKFPKVTPIKMKTEGDVDGPSPPKKPKDEDDEQLQRQNKIIYQYRDQLKKQLKKKNLSFLLSYNDQKVPGGEESMLDHLADIMTFGIPEGCEQCKGGQFVYQSGVGYQCQGDLTEWTKCNNVIIDPKKKPFEVPKELKEKFDFLAKYKYVPQKRIIRINAPSATISEASTSKTKTDRPERALDKLEFVLLGKFNKSKDEIKKDIVGLGGKVVSKLHEGIAAVISTPEEVEKMGKKMKEVKDLDVHVVPEDFLEEVKNGSALLLISKNNICSWGSDPASRIKADEVDSNPILKSKSGSRFIKSTPDKVKLKLKGGVVVDPDSGLEDIAHVYQKNGEVYNAVLGITDVQSSKNSYYKLQVLESDNRNSFWIFRSWGRIGTTIGNNKLESVATLQDALYKFKLVFKEKTGNYWEKRKNFLKVPGRMVPIDVEYGDDDKLPEIGNASIDSKLAKPVQDLVKMLFDIDTMKKVMMEFEIDLKKMPLGKLSKRQIHQAYNVLTDLQELMKSGASDSHFVDASNQFYTLIPHDFGMDTPPVLKTEEMIKQKIEMLDSLLEIEIAFNMLKEHEDGDDALNPIDAHYAKLNTDIEILDKDSEEFKLLQEYVKNTHADTHKYFELEIEQVFRVKRHGEDKRYSPFRKLHNRKLLWHGSRLTNFVGILSQGLRIAPPEAPVSGYMFGKGIYFADMVSKSANYCCTSVGNPTGLMLLCEVALGNMYERPHGDYIQKLPKDKHSVKGLGVTEPDPNKSVKRPDGVEIPIGTGVKMNRQGVSLLYNEYIVYDVAQVNIQYLLQMKFNHNY